MENKEVVLKIKNLNMGFKTDYGYLPIIHDINYEIYAGETLGVVGESGCGKSVTSLCIMRLLNGGVVEGEIELDGQNLLKLSEKKMQEIRGNQIAMIFQEPMTSLNPVFTVGYQLTEALRRHQGMNKKDAWARAIEMLDLVRIAEPDQRMKEYPYQLSGGMRQRVMIAMALACRPRLLIADEPTTALDVTIQAQVLDLMRGLQKELGTSILFITHDLGVIREMADRVIVMYCGEIMEEATVTELFKNPK
ncbi:MAG: ABC transporter ATP-binding protein, partial [Oscillospiraceae bacterium]|nr:ABC transporter ATP-binding protein [Oscillospiraceae bacterium]